nr:putative reverse transcriptase, RNA-dependent DNA polymerase [Tanacetum cinerariifolium]
VRPIGTKWVLKNKKDERGIVIKNKAQEEGIDYDEPPGFQDPESPTKVYKVEKAIYGLHQAPRAWSSNTPMDKENPWGKDGTRKDVDLHLYRSMIGSSMYLTASRPDIMFAVCAYTRHQVTPKECHLHTVKRIFRYLKGHPKLGLWYPKESPFDLVAYTDSDYGGATEDHKSTTGGCQFLGRRLISWQCKKQTIVATSTTEAKYVAAASCCGQVLWIQNQLLDYGYNFMNTRIYIDNNSAICTKVDASKDEKKDVSSLRYIVLPNWGHEDHLESTSSQPQGTRNTDVPKSSRNSNPTTTLTNLPDDQLETLIVETPIPTASSPVPTFEDILGDTSNSEESNGVEADVWSLVDYPKGVIPIGTEWVLKNKKDERGIVIRFKARLVAQGHTQEEGIDYDEVFAPVAKIKAIRLFLAYASFMGFIVYQMDVKSVFLYGTIDEEVYVMQPPGFQDPEYPARVYKVEKAIEFEALMYEKFQMSAIGELKFFLGLQVLQKEDGIFLSQDKYVGDILKKFGYSDVRSSNTPMDKENPWAKDGTGKDVDLHLYRSMIGSLMYLTASRPDIMFAVCACARHQVTPKEWHLHAVKRIFRYLKGHPKLGLWYPNDSPFDLVAYLDSDYGGATQDRKSTSGGCQFLGRRLISWQCKSRQL